MITDFDVNCPYCGETFNTIIDYSMLINNNVLVDNSNTLDSTQPQDYTYIEDCQVCCQPILFTPVINQNGELQDVITRQENE